MSDYFDDTALEKIRREEAEYNNLVEEARIIGADISSCRMDIPCIKQKIEEKKRQNTQKVRHRNR